MRVFRELMKAVCLVSSSFLKRDKKRKAAIHRVMQMDGLGPASCLWHMQLPLPPTQLTVARVSLHLTA